MRPNQDVCAEIPLSMRNGQKFHRVINKVPFNPTSSSPVLERLFSM
jgi:hypothetical protein